MQSIYLSEAAPRLLLATESDLQAAVDEGLLVESHYLDLKRELSAGSGKNLEHARALAAFAVDGGTIIIGVQEDRQARRLQLVPQVLSGLRERVEQIARFTPDPPVPVRTQEIPTANDPSQGYLIVHVPASPLAPHMVDGRYLGRGDATNQRLSAEERESFGPILTAAQDHLDRMAATAGFMPAEPSTD